MSKLVIWLTLCVAASLGLALPLQDMSTKRLRDMTFPEVDELSGEMIESFDNSGITCLDKAKTTMTFVLMTPRGAFHLPSVRTVVQHFYHHARFTVPQTMALTKLVTQCMDTLFEPLKNVIPTQTKELGVVSLEVKKLVEKAPLLTGKELLDRFNNIIPLVAKVDCNDMLSTEKMRSLLQTAAIQLLELGQSREVTVLERLESMVKTRVGQIFKDPDFAQQLSIEVIANMEGILEDLTTTARLMSKALPLNLPMHAFLSDLVNLGDEAEGDSAEGSQESSSKSIESEEKRSEEDSNEELPSTFTLPQKSEDCYRPKLAVYNMAVMRLMKMARKAMFHLAFRKVDTISEADKAILIESMTYKYPLQTNLYKDAEVLENHKNLRMVVRIMKKATDKVLETLRTEDTIPMDETNLPQPFRRFLARVTTPRICGVDTVFLYKQIEQTLNNLLTDFTDTDGSVKFIEPTLAAKLNPDTLNKITATLKPIMPLLTKAFRELVTAFRDRTFSTQSLLKVAEVWHKIKMEAAETEPLKRQGPTTDVIQVAMNENDLTGDELVTDASVTHIKLRAVIKALIANLESSVKPECTEKVTLVMTKDLVGFLVRLELRETLGTIRYLLRKNKVGRGATSKVSSIVRQQLNNNLMGLLNDLPGGDMRKNKLALLLTRPGKGMKLRDVLTTMYTRAESVLTDLTADCTETVNFDKWTSIITEATKTLHTPLDTAALSSSMQTAMGTETATELTPILIETIKTTRTELDALLSALSDLSSKDALREEFVHLFENGIQMHIRLRPDSPNGQPKRSMDTATGLFRNPIITRITSKYSEILAGLLVQKTTPAITASDIRTVITNTINSVLSTPMKRGAGENEIDQMQRLTHLLDILKDVELTNLPEDVIRNTVITMARNVQSTVPTECRMPIRARFLAGFVKYVLQDLMDVRPDHPLFGLVVPTLQRMDPKNPMKMEKAMAILRKIVPVISNLFTRKMENMPIFEGVDRVVDLLKDVLTPRQGESAPDKFRRIRPTLMAVLKNPDMCKPVNSKELIRQAEDLVESLFKSKKLEPENLVILLKGVVPEMETRQLVKLILNKVVPEIEEGLEDFLNYGFEAFRDDDFFPVFYSYALVHFLGLDVPPIQRLFDTPIYELFLREVQIALVAKILPQSTLAAEDVTQLLGVAYMQTLQILGLQQW